MSSAACHRSQHQTAAGPPLTRAGRRATQGLDTATHFGIIWDLCGWAPALAPTGGYTAALWLAHTAACQATRKSTATLFVEAFKAALYGGQRSAGLKPARDLDSHGGKAASLAGGPDTPLRPPSVADEARLLAAKLAGGAAGAALALAWLAGLASPFALYLGASLAAAVVVSAHEAVRAAQARPRLRPLPTPLSPTRPAPVRGSNRSGAPARAPARA